MGIYIRGHIEPCPVCGARVAHYFDHDGMLGCAGHCGYGLVYDGDKSLEIHNRLSKMVRKEAQA